MKKRKSRKDTGTRPQTKRRARRAKGRRRTRAIRPWDLSLASPVKDSRLQGAKIGDFYRPLKKPITVRIDADVLAWFQKDGRRYQTRINAALRKVMEREMKAGG